MKKISALSLAACISLSISTTSNAGSLRDFTNSVYRSFTTSGGPDNFRSNSGDNVYTGGAYSLRFGVDDVQLIDFEPPQVSASCSGIDFFAGSIAFGSRDEVIQLGRNIAAAATVYAFKLALNSVCPSCASIMQNIQAWVEKLNALANVSCQDALKIMEAADEEDESKAPSDKKWSILGQEVDGWSDPEEFMANDAHDNYFKQILAKGITLVDMLQKSPGTIPDVTDMGYFIAYNTDLPKHLFPFYDDDLQKMATWSILSRGKKCVNVTSEEADGSYCGLTDTKMAHDYASFIWGNSRGSASSSSEMTLPLCDEHDSIGTSSFGSFQVCDFSKKKYTEVVRAYTKTAPALQHQIMQDVFGVGAIRDDGTLDSTKVCKGKFVIKGIDSMFAKNLTVGNGFTQNLTNSQAYVASLLGTQYTRDLYRLNSEGNYLKSDEFHAMTNCGALAELVRSRTTSIIDQIEEQALVELGNAARKYASTPKYTDVYQKMVWELKLLETRIRLSIDARKAQSEADSKNKANDSAEAGEA